MTQTAIAQRQVLPTFSILAALSAVLWAATAVAHLAHTQSEDEFGPTGDYVIEGLFFGALLASAVAVATIAPQAEGRTAKAGVWLAAVGHAMLAASALTSLLAGTADGWLGPLFPLGLLAIAVGLLLLNRAGRSLGLVVHPPTRPQRAR
jgi:hypothetical protein